MRSEKEKIYDAWLAASARLGDRQALSLLAERWNARLLAHACRLTGEPELAADVTQEAWTQIIKGIAGLDDADAFAAWAFRIVTRRCARAIKSRQRRRAGIAALGREPQPNLDRVDLASLGEQQTDLAVIQAAMRELPPDQRAALALFYLEDFRVAEIAVALDAPVGTIKTRLMHARRKLRAKLQGESQ
ncbi:MAG: RNA polymerase sigma factor [Wenzhouxiangellaceae bacterium]|nr:RNA polymerase sigma factor [Wenzhouxiangellaceae bacterium]